MTFTDEDLKRLEEMGTVEKERWIRGETNVAPLEALVSRLQAAESAIPDLMQHGAIMCRNCMSKVSAWRKVAGK